ETSEVSPEAIEIMIIDANEEGISPLPETIDVELVATEIIPRLKDAQSSEQVSELEDTAEMEPAAEIMSDNEAEVDIAVLTVPEEEMIEELDLSALITDPVLVNDEVAVISDFDSSTNPDLEVVSGVLADNISEIVEEVQLAEPESVVNISSAVNDQQMGDIEHEIRHNIAEGILDNKHEEQTFQEIEAGNVPVLSEQKHVKSARQRMMEDKVNRLLEAGFTAKFASDWAEAISRFEEILKISTDLSLRGMLIRDIAVMYLELADYHRAEETYQTYLGDSLTTEERNDITRELLKLRYMEQELKARNMPMMPYRKVPRLLQIKVEDTLNRTDTSKQVEGSKKRK
ncbi:MAG: hypothetical protein ACM3O9_07185, partial [Methylocystaceae bacterium]